ncbi:hypothetical protein AB0K21_37820 [Streptosporangium sp. NPDC049248]|uniref:hypothetical protein n=1 Tax=Streptosporangium sp. NPDC049248 TaxID=3155651 RepID=UPI00342AC8E6
MHQHGTTDRAALTGDQIAALARVIGHTFPRWAVWELNGHWYAAGPYPNSMCSRTLHADGPAELCRQLDHCEQLPVALQKAPL